MIKLITKPFSDLILAILLISGYKYQWYTELIDGSDTLSTRPKVERVFTLFSSPKSVEGAKLLSVMLIDWMKVCRRVKPDKKTGCPYHKPVTCNMRLRTFFASMKKLYCWQYVQKDLEGWDGCFGAWMEKEYSRRGLEYVSHGHFYVCVQK